MAGNAKQIDKNDLNLALAGIKDSDIRDSVLAGLLTLLPVVTNDGDNKGKEKDEEKYPKWNLKNNFLKEDLDLNTMKGESFKRWLRQFKGYLTEAGFYKPHVTDTQRLRALEQCTIPTTYDRICSLKLSLPIPDQSNMEKILTLLETTCGTDDNVWSKRKLFHDRKQKDGELFQDFVLEVRQLATKCDFGESFCETCTQVASDQFLLHQIVFGVNNLEVQTEFLKKDNLTIELATKIAEKFETLRKAQTVIMGEDSPALHQVLYTGPSSTPHYEYAVQRQFSAPVQNQSRYACFNCGQDGHKAKDIRCPARDSTCEKCHRRGHVGKVCRSTGNQPQYRPTNRFTPRSRPPRANATFADGMNDYYDQGQYYNNPRSEGPHMGALVSAVCTTTKNCTIKVVTQSGSSSKVKGLIDTGSDWNAAGPQHLRHFQLCIEDLQPPTLAMQDTKVANGSELNCLGYVDVNFMWGGTEIVDKLVFFDNFPNVLYSMNLLTNLGVVTINTEPVSSMIETTTDKNFLSAVTNERTTVETQPTVTQTIQQNHQTTLGAEKSQSNNTLPSDIPTRAEIMEEFADVFAPRDEPMEGEPLHITLKENATPTCVSATRGVPASLEPHLRREVTELEGNQIIRKVTKPTTWCAPVVLLPKKRDPKLVRLAGDFRGLNRHIRREYFQSTPPLETVQSIPAEEAVYFSSADCWKGHHQKQLDEESIDLTTFILPFKLGRYQYVRAPFGISNISEIYDRSMAENLDTLSNHRRVSDDNLIYSKDPHTQVSHVRNLLQRCREKRIRLSAEKFVYMQETIEWAGFQLSRNGYQIQNRIINAISEFPIPKTKTDLRSFQGMANQLAGFNEELTRVLNPIRDLLKHDVEFFFDDIHRKSFEKAKQILTSNKVMAFYRPNAPLQLFTDASTLNGLGFVLKQKQPNGSWKPIQVGSRTLTDPEKRYAPIELELTGLVYALAKARSFLAGATHFTVFTDQKPLVTILNKRRLDEIQNQRILRLVMRTVDYNFTAEYIKGSTNIAADALSRNPVDEPSADDKQLEEEYRIHTTTICTLLANEAEIPNRLLKVKTVAQDDLQYQSLTNRIIQGFPEHRRELEEDLREFWDVRDELSLSDDGFILYGVRLLIPKLMRRDILEELHKGHRGIEGSCERARLVVYWPGIDAHIAQWCKNCEKCFKTLPTQPREPAKNLPIPTRAYEITSTDLFTYQGKKGIVFTDWYSGWFSWCWPLTSTVTPVIIPILRKFFTDCAVPDILFSDNGPPYNALEFSDFLKRWGICHNPSSAYYPQGNSYAELAVKNIKSLLEKYYNGPNTDWDGFDRAILQIRNTPHKNTNLSPAMLLYGRPVQDALPAHKSMFSHEWHQRIADADRKFAERRDKLTSYYNRGTKELPPLTVGTPVAIQNRQNGRWDRYGIIQEAKPNIRKYFIRLASGMVVTRNRRFIRIRIIHNRNPMPPIKTLDCVVPDETRNSTINQGDGTAIVLPPRQEPMPRPPASPRLRPARNRREPDWYDGRNRDAQVRRK